jgi:hypothetical protein
MIGSRVSCPGGPSMGYQPMQSSDLDRASELSLAAHLECAKEGRQRVHGRPRALSKAQLMKV